MWFFGMKNGAKFWPWKGDKMMRYHDKPSILGVASWQSHLGMVIEPWYNICISLLKDFKISAVCCSPSLSTLTIKESASSTTTNVVRLKNLLMKLGWLDWNSLRRCSNLPGEATRISHGSQIRAFSFWPSGNFWPGTISSILKGLDALLRCSQNGDRSAQHPNIPRGWWL